MERTESYSEMPIYSIDPPPRKTGKRGIVIWIFIIIGIIILGLIINAIGSSIFGGKKVSKPAKPYIAVLHVEGTITQENRDSWGRPYGYQHKFTLDQIDQLINDENNKGIMLFINSPGGGVYESDELYFKIKEYKGSTMRPVYSYMGSMAASGGYYVASPADKILANRNCWTGSIGVTIGTLFDVSGFLEHHGIKSTTITSGRNKAMGSVVDPLSSEQKEIFQSLVDEAYMQFVNIVKEERNMDMTTVIEIADGRIYTAYQAMDISLIDGISTFDGALAQMAKAHDLEGCLIHHIMYKDDSFFGMLFDKLPLPDLPQSNAATVITLMKRHVEFPISYLCEILM